MSSEQQIKKLTEDIDAYLQEKGIPSQSINIFLSMDKQELAESSCEDLFGIAYEIQAHSYLIQNLINEKQTIVAACQKKIDKCVGHKLNDYNIFGTREKWLMAIADNDTATELEKVMEGPNHIIMRLNWLSNRLESVSKTVFALAQTKKKDNYHAN